MNSGVSLKEQIAYFESKLFHDKHLMRLSAICIFEATLKSLNKLNEIEEKI